MNDGLQPFEEYLAGDIGETIHYWTDIVKFRWINWFEYTPQYGGWYLVFMIEKATTREWVWLARLDVTDYTWSVAGFKDEDFYVTHWTRLPPEPEE